MRLHRLGVTVLAAAALFGVAAPAGAAPITVDLRVEGPSGTVFQGPVNTDVAPFRFTDSETAYPCGTGAVTRGAVLAAASRSARTFHPSTSTTTTGFSLLGSFDATTGSPTITSVGGQDVRPSEATGRRLAEYVDGVAATSGACQDVVAPGDDVVFAWGTGAPPERVLALAFVGYTGPVCSADPTIRSIYRVTDEATGQPVQGAAVADELSDADGVVRVGGFPRDGVRASRAGDVASATIPPQPVPPCPPPNVPPPPQQETVTSPSAPPPAAGAPTPVAPQVTLRSAPGLRLGALRLTATSDVAGTSRVSVRLGGVRVARSLTFAAPGSVTTGVRTTARQNRRLRRALGRGAIRFRATITAAGASATASGVLRR